VQDVHENVNARQFTVAKHVLTATAILLVVHFPGIINARVVTVSRPAEMGAMLVLSGVPAVAPVLAAGSIDPVAGVILALAVVLVGAKLGGEIAERLQMRKKQAGLEHRNDIKTFVDYIDTDEKRIA